MNQLGAGESLLDRRRKQKKTSRADELEVGNAALIPSGYSGQVTSHSFIDNQKGSGEER